MKFVSGKMNGKYLLELHEKAITSCDAVRMAVAYAAGEDHLILDCRDKGIPLTFYGRYDSSVPVAPPILKLFLDAKSPNMACKLVPDIFHPKVIWWQGVGVYLGSANLTPNGWYRNIEAGIYLDDSDMAESSLEMDLNQFFTQLDGYSFNLTNEIYEEMRQQSDATSSADRNRQESGNAFDKRRIIPKLSSLVELSKKSTADESKKQFLKEWSNTLEILRNLGERISTDNNRPSWVPNETPKGVQVDQFLHAYYYNHVKIGSRSTHVALHKKNRLNAESAITNAISWWAALPSAPHGEEITIKEWSPFLISKLANTSVLQLDESDFVDVCSRIHALSNHSLRVKNMTLGLPKGTVTDGAARVQLLGKWLFEQKSSVGHNILERINYVLYGGSRKDVPIRIWDAINSEKWYIPHFGISTIGELVGWALPDQFPPRNGRTSKALYSLGYQVTIHSQ